MAHKKAGGSSRNGRDSEAKRLGVKLFGGQVALPGNVILRQRGTKWHAGENVGMGRDHTLYATAEGQVTFKNGWKSRQFVSIVPVAKAIAAE
jgi:large subunit ribosomal protein L27